MGLIVVGVLLFIVGGFLQAIGTGEPVPPPPKWNRHGKEDDPLAIDGVSYEVEEEEPDSEGMELLINEGILNREGEFVDRQKGIIWFMKEAKKKKRSPATEEAIEILGPILESK